MTQPGYDALADLYAETFPTPYQSLLEQHVVAAFADTVRDSGVEGVVLDIGSGLGHVAADLADRGLDVIGIEPSQNMLAIARRDHPHIAFVDDDALLRRMPLAETKISAIIARYSLIHVPPTDIPTVLNVWANAMEPGGILGVALQATDTAGEIEEFDHLVAPAWRWHPDRLSDVLADAGFHEMWRTVNRADEQYRFPTAHLVARRC